MNLDQATAIAALATELLKSIDQTKIQMPTKMWATQDWSLRHLDTTEIEDGQLKFSWSYHSCGSIDHDTTYQPLSDFFGTGE